MRFSLRFDFRSPEFAGVPLADRFAAAIEMAVWADDLGATSILLPEHHGSPDGLLPSPLPVAAAMAARTKQVRLSIAAFIGPFHDPLRLAEDIAVVDQLARGRLDIIVVGGWARHEFDMFGVEMRERPKRVTEVVTTLKQAFTGEPFEFRGRTVRVTPTPCQPGGPPVVMGGDSEGAARRAARIADGFVPSNPGPWDFYRDELSKLGKPDPGPTDTGDGSHVTLSDDPEAAWERLGPYLLHDWNSYVSCWFYGAEETFTPETDVAVLRANGRYRILTPAQYVEELHTRSDPLVTLHPMCGGIPPELAWESLRLFEREVRPKFA
ncbi:MULTISPECIES: LLM class flavin-dependent oxidoreductase [unclassified Pseudofrankia]|uniref:LLM class flavin-dependent oxidoreductase n=1 Tax=unclassified Pseudofrankia TaxID=2994372 RepID=UPI0008DAD0D4|nr:MULTISPECIES: LLM class flavin-dependent oxidoreductase [unclassified Pseudofrankia]MDT3439265.1 LLM class flavin-dependent oxidoreductase [Pseudofrankia sp. BMG5.37]OHV43783.1 luciferase [Pseudofrankia sp. BMG5.36]